MTRMASSITITIRRMVLVAALLIGLIFAGQRLVSAYSTVRFLTQTVQAAQTEPGTGLIIENVGQFPEDVRFVVWGGAQPLWLMSDGIYAPGEAGMARMALAADLGVPQPALPSRTTVSFFLGNDPTAWRADVPVWGAVRYAGADGSHLTVSADGQIRHSGVSPTQPDAVSPHLLYATLLRGNKADEEGAVAVDAAGNAYVVGQTRSDDFPVTAGGVFTGYQGGTQDVFVAKVAPDGQSLIYATFLGGKDSDLGKQIVVDGGGNAYIIGDTSSTDYPSTAGAFDPTHAGANIDAFITRLNPAGTALGFSTFLGGNNYENAQAIALTDNGDLVLTGRTQSVDFFVTPGAYSPIFRGDWDIFVTRMNGDGSDVLFSTFLGGNRNDGPGSLAVDTDGNIYLGGYTWSSAFPTTAGAYDTTFNGGYTDAFVLKLAADGSDLLYSTLLGGGAGEAVRGVAVDATGHAIITGFTASPGFPVTAGAFDTTPNGGDDAFVVKLLPDGSGLAFSTLLGGELYDYGRGIEINSSGEILVAGETESLLFPTTPGAVSNRNSGQQDLFAVKLSPDGTTLAYGTYLGGSKTEALRGMALDSSGHLYVSGHTTSPDFAATVIGPAIPADSTTADILVAKLETPTTPIVRLFLPALNR